MAKKPVKHQRVLNDPLMEKLVKAIKRGPVSFQEVCNKLDLSPKKAEALIKKAKQADVPVHLENDHIGLVSQSIGLETQEARGIPPTVSGRQTVAVISDTHLGSKYCLREQLADFVNFAYNERGVRQILHVGDILDGDYRHGKFEVSHTGLEDQTEDLCQVLPHLPGLTYHAITGNHDYTFTERAGLSVGPYIESYFRAQGRRDFFSYGDRSAFLRIRGARVHLWHPKKGCGYAKSYPIQKQIERYVPGEKPDILLIGHWHVFEHTFERGVHGVACPTFQGGGSAFGKSLGGAPAIGGVVLNWELTEQGVVRNFGLEHRAYYEKETLWDVDQALGIDLGIEVPTPPTRTGFARRLKINPPNSERWGQ